MSAESFLVRILRPPDAPKESPPTAGTVEGAEVSDRQNAIESTDSIEAVNGSLGVDDYLRAGWSLCAIPAGQKGPTGTGWQRRGEKNLAKLRAGNVGLLHALSGTAALDIDDLDHARTWLAERDIDLDALLADPMAVRISSGRPGRAKLLYRLGRPLATIQRGTYRNAEGKKRKALELRCATGDGASVQDCLPPSIHPETGRPYEWVFDDLVADPLSPPLIPDALLALWKAELAPRAERTEVPTPTGASWDELRAVLAGLEASCTRDEWVDVLMRLHHEMQGSEDGFALADEWSSGGENYRGTADVRKVWNSFRLDRANSVTLAGLLARMPATVDEFDVIPEPREKPARAVVRIGTADQENALAQLGRVLASAARWHRHVVYGGAIVKAYTVERRGFRGERVESLELNRLTAKALAADLNEVAEFHRQRADGKSQRIECPVVLVQTLMERPETWPGYGLPHIERLAETPVLVAGTLHTAPGFCEPASAWIHAPVGVSLPGVLDERAAQAALARVREWLAEFPFETATDEAVAVSALLTAAMRASLPAAPGFVFDKPTFGAGASTLCKLVHIVLTGREPAVTTVDRGEEELSKAIDSLQVAGAAAIVLDNLPAGEQLASIALAQVLSEPFRRPRLLGSTRTATVACTQMVMLTGVNVGVADDLVRRFLRCRIDPQVERPEDRVFRRPELLEEAKAARGALLSDLYTIVAAAQRVRAAGPTLAGFDAWARTCVAPLTWLGLPDPIESSRGLQSEDPAREALGELLRTWHAAYGGRVVTVAELLDDAIPDGSTEGEARGTCRRLLLDEVGGERVGVDPAKRVGRLLVGYKGRAVGGLRLVRLDRSKGKIATWAVRSLAVGV